MIQVQQNKLYDKKNQMDFKAKLSNIRIRSKKEDKQENEIKNIANLYDAREDFLKIILQ